MIFILAEIIKTKRKERGKTLRQAAKDMGISHTTLFYIESGTYEPAVVTLVKILNYYGLDFNKIYNQGDEFNGNKNH